MGASYQPISWNRQKQIYDGIIGGGIALYLTVFIAVCIIFNPDVTSETLLIRSTATLALLLLHVILAIGPMARLNKVFLPLLYNRRHLGLTMFTVSLIHGAFSIIQFHSLGNVNPIVSLFTSNTHFESLTKFPFQALGFFALVILFLMAITSHDFWLHNLGPRIWKTLHMMVYIAYALIICHVLLGVMQYETSTVLFVMLVVGMITIITLHWVAGAREHRIDQNDIQVVQDQFVMACSVAEIPEKRAKVVVLGEERVAIFKYDGKIAAMSNVCKHQSGPLGEGKIIDGCVTCPWHGYQYLPHNGSSPPPFKEKVSTYDVKILNDEVWINPSPYPEGTERPPAIIK